MNVFEWLIWAIPNMNFIFGRHLNVVGLVWFILLFLYAFQQIRTRYSGPHRVIMAGFLGFIVTLTLHYTLDELSVVMAWLMYGFDSMLFFGKMGVYTSIVVGVDTLYSHARSYLKFDKTTMTVLVLLIGFNVFIFNYLHSTFGTLSSRDLNGYDKTWVFWSIYPLAKTLWAMFFLSLWKPKRAGLEPATTDQQQFQARYGTGELYMVLAEAMMRQRVEQQYGASVDVFTATNKLNFGTQLLFENVDPVSGNPVFTKTLDELVHDTQTKGYTILEQGYYDTPPWFDSLMPVVKRRKAFPLPMGLIRILLRMERLGNRFTSHHVYVVGRRIG